MEKAVNKKLKSGWTPVLYILPAGLFLTVFIIIPVIFSVVMSLYRIPALGADWEFIGFGNFADVIKEKDILGALGRTLGFGAFGVLTSLFFGILLAMLVAGDKHLNFYRYIFYVPGVVSSITMGMLYTQILDPTKFGVLNSLLLKMGWIDQPFQWLNSEQWTWVVVNAIGLIGCGGGMSLILFTTAINDISKEIKESAMLEGANGFQLNMKIILPLIKPMIFSWTLLSIIGSLKSFEFIYTLTQGGPNHTTTTLAILLFSNEKSGILGYGYSSALGLFMTLIVLAFTGAYYLFANKRLNAED